MLSCDLSLITMHISDCCQFSDIHISQGSVATYLRCGGIFKYECVANLPVSLPVKEFWKSVNIWGSYGQEFSVLFFLRHSVLNAAVASPRGGHVHPTFARGRSWDWYKSYEFLQGAGYRRGSVRFFWLCVAVSFGLRFTKGPVPETGTLATC